MKPSYLIPILVVSIILTSCAGPQRRYYPPPRKKYPLPEAKTAPAKPSPEVVVPRQPRVRQIPATPTSPPVLALLNSAENERQSGRLDTAVATLERAIHIQPRNALLWQRMAALRMEQHKPRLALDLARKSNTLTADRGLKRTNWQLIAEAKRLLGDRAGAAAALREAEQ